MKHLVCIDSLYNNNYTLIMSIADRLSIEKVDPDLKRDFKVHCINKGSTMRAEIIAYMEKTVKQAEKRRKA